MIEYIKRNKIMIGAIVIVALLILFVATRASEPATQVVNTGPSEAELAAKTQIALASIAAGVETSQAQAQVAAIQTQGQAELALANIGAQVSMADIQANERLTYKAQDAQLQALAAQLAADSAIVQSNNQFQIDYARVASDNALEQVKINAALQANLAQQQSDVFKYTAAISTIPDLKKKDRDNVLLALTGKAVTPYASPFIQLGSSTMN